MEEVSRGSTLFDSPLNFIASEFGTRRSGDLFVNLCGTSVLSSCDVPGAFE